MTMNPALILISFLFITTSAEKKCYGVYFNEKYYDVHIIKDGLNHVHALVLNPNDNTLYFTFDQISTVPTRVLGYLNLNTKIAGTIDGIRNASSVAIDQLYNVVYASGSDGIYRINSRKVPEKLPLIDSVESLFFKDGLYYSNRMKEAYKYKNGRNELVPELIGVPVDKIIVDDDNNIFFLEENRLFRVKLGTRAINTHERYLVDFITTDLFYRPYVSTSDGIYAYNKYKYALDKASNLRNLKAMTFNRQFEPIYVISDLLVKLNYSATPCHDF